MTETIEPRTKVYDILKDFSTAMMVTAGTDGRPESRPMHIAAVEPVAGYVWFLAGRGGAMVREIEAQPEVLLVLQNDHAAYLSVRGKANRVEDPARVRSLWKDMYKVWFPAGPDDPEIVLIAVHPTEAEYWDNRGSNKIEYMFEAAKAYI